MQTLFFFSLSLSFNIEANKSLLLFSSHEGVWTCVALNILWFSSGKEQMTKIVVFWFNRDYFNTKFKLSGLQRFLKRKDRKEEDCFLGGTAESTFYLYFTADSVKMRETTPVCVLRWNHEHHRRSRRLTWLHYCTDETTDGLTCGETWDLKHCRFSLYFHLCFYVFLNLF